MDTIGYRIKTSFAWQSVLLCCSIITWSDLNSIFFQWLFLSNSVPFQYMEIYLNLRFIGYWWIPSIVKHCKWISFKILTTKFGKLCQSDWRKVQIIMEDTILAFQQNSSLVPGFVFNCHLELLLVSSDSGNSRLFNKRD